MKAKWLILLGYVRVDLNIFGGNLYRLIGISTRMFS